MDNVQIAKIISQIGVLKHKFCGSFPADLVPSTLPKNSFCIINSDVSSQSGTHWIVLVNKHGKLYFGDSLGQRMSSYKNILFHPKERVKHIAVGKIQNEQICGLYCIYFAYIMFANVSEKHIDDNFILRFFSVFI